MQPLLAITGLTWKAAFRYRLFWVIAVLLLLAVTGMPLLLKDDGTSEGFAQILITYTLSAVTALLGFCTLWLSCGTLARDIEDCQLQMVTVKPIARWQVWLGKWLGIITLNAVLLALAGLSIYGTLEWRARKLPAPELARLQNEVLVARSSVKEEGMEALITEATDADLKRRMAKSVNANVNPLVLRQQIEAQVKAEAQTVPSGAIRPWIIHLPFDGARLKNRPLFLRIKFVTSQVASANAEPLHVGWQVGTEKKTQIWQELMSLTPDSFHEFPIPANLFDEKGNLLILFRNLSETTILFPLENGLEVLYREGGFGLNFVRGLGIILCWMTLLAALGLASASLLSFPVAAFFSIALLAITFSSGTLTNVVSDGTLMGYDEEKGAKGHSVVDTVAVPTFKGLLSVINLVQGFSPIDSLSTGRSITWTQLGLAVIQIVLMLGGFFAIVGVIILNRRELATAQGIH